jgi:hypothetical protein
MDFKTETLNYLEEPWGKYPDATQAPEGYEYKFRSPPKANWRYHFGAGDMFRVELYTKNPPNRFQRWVAKWALGITWERIE